MGGILHGVYICGGITRKKEDAGGIKAKFDKQREIIKVTLRRVTIVAVINRFKTSLRYL